PWEAPVGPRRRLLAEEGAVGPDHPDRVAEEAPDPIGVRTRGDLARAEVLGEQQVAQDVDGVITPVVDQLPEAAALPAAVLGSGQIADPDVAQAALAGEQLAALRQIVADPRPDLAIREPLLGPGRATGLNPDRDQDQESRAGPLVGIGVEGDVLAGRTGLVDEV